jgi:hypothetical protein
VQKETPMMVYGKPQLVQPVKEALLQQRVNLFLDSDRLLPIDNESFFDYYESLFDL